MEAFLPCNGLDKPFGPLSREVALCLARESEGEIVCPVLLNQAPERYRETLASAPLTVIDGCATRCASKLAARLELKVSRRVFIPDEVKRAAVKPENGMVPGPQALEFAKQVARGAGGDAGAPESASSAVAYTPPTDFIRVTVDKYVFRVPSEGFRFNENDCWAQVSGNRARVGVSDFVQQNMTDITWFDPPEVGAVVEQFGELGQIESSKAVMEIVSPVSGRVVAVNRELKDRPELVNEDPYGKGWIAELELADLAADGTFLIGPDAYAEIVRRKAEEAAAR